MKERPHIVAKYLATDRLYAIRSDGWILTRAPTERTWVKWHDFFYPHYAKAYAELRGWTNISDNNPRPADQTIPSSNITIGLHFLGAEKEETYG